MKKQVNKLDSIPLKRCLIAMAYEIGKMLQGIYELKDAGEAIKLFRKLMRLNARDARANRLLLAPISRDARKFEGESDGILAHWSRELATAFTEDQNRLFTALKRKACAG
jgi:hypothetical protein